MQLLNFHWIKQLPTLCIFGTLTLDQVGICQLHSQEPLCRIKLGPSNMSAINPEIFTFFDLEDVAVAFVLLETSQLVAVLFPQLLLFEDPL